MIDIATVVFRDEIPLLRQQAESVNLYCKELGVRNIYVVLNDDDSLITEIDPAWWGDLAHQVLVVPRSTFSAPWVEDGWLSQQLWKLLIASMSYNTFTMVLDAKTVFVRPLLISELIGQDGKLRVGHLPIYPVFDSSREITEAVLGIQMSQQIGPGGVPFFFHNDTVRFMIADITYRTHQSFPHWFQSQGKLTEFILYSGYVQARYGSIHSIYSEECGVWPVNICHSQVDQFDTLMSRAAESQTTTVSVHRRAWTALTTDQRQQYRNFLIDRYLLSAVHLV